MKPADIHLLALDYEPVWLARFCGQRHFTPAIDSGCGFPDGNRLAPPVVLNLHSTLPSDEGERNHGV